MLIILVTGVNNISNVSQGNNCTFNGEAVFRRIWNSEITE